MDSTSSDRWSFLGRPRTLFALAVGIAGVSPFWGYYVVFGWLFSLFVGALGLAVLKVGDRAGVRWVTGLLLASFVFLGVVRFGFMGQTRTFLLDAQWEIASSGDLEMVDGSVEAGVRLLPVAYPGHVDGYASNALAEYLGGLESSAVPVLYEVTYDLYSVRGYHIVRVGDRPLCWSDCEEGELLVYDGYSGYARVPGQTDVDATRFLYADGSP